MKYYHAYGRTHAEYGHPDDLLKMGDVISFGDESFATKNDYITYYNPKTDGFDIPDNITLKAVKGGDHIVTYSKGFVGKEITVSTKVEMPLSSKFMITGFRPESHSYNGGDILPTHKCGGFTAHFLVKRLSITTR